MQASPWLVRRHNATKNNNEFSDLTFFGKYDIFYKLNDYSVIVCHFLSVYRMFSVQFIRSFLVFVAATFLCIHGIQATHVVGGEITYRCEGPNQYTISLSLIRDCYGISLPSSTNIQYSSPSCAGGSLLLSRTSVQEVSSVCPSTSTSCNGGPLSGYEQHTYEGLLTLSATCQDVLLEYSICCRSSSITNLVSPSSTSFFIQTKFKNSSTLCNNSPTFSPQPPFLAAGAASNVNIHAVDTDGDSLAFHLIPAQQSTSQQVPFNAGFSASNPIASSPSYLSLDPLTGMISLSPYQQKAVMCIRIDEYRDGVLIGSVKRETIVSVVNSSDPPVIGAPINVVGGAIVGSEIQMAAGDTMTFDLPVSDPNAVNQVTTSVYARPGLGKVTTIGNNPGTIRVTLYPSLVGTHLFHVKVNNDNCPFTGVTTASFQVRVSKALPVFPVQLLSFEGMNKGDHIELFWSTATEQGNDRFLLEKRMPAGEFKEFRVIPGAGTSETAISYSEIDFSPSAGTNTYRLSQIDIDGVQTSLSTVEVTRADHGEKIGRLYPNPATSFISLEIDPRETDIYASLYTITGRFIKRYHQSDALPDGAFRIQTEDLPSGTYFLRIAVGGQSFMRHFSKL